MCPGLSALTPALTIVRRGTDGDGDNPDHFLPSVRTPPSCPAGAAGACCAVCARKMFGPMQAEERALVDDVQVMTCANYIKLPKYSSPEVLKTQLSKVRKTCRPL